MIHEIAIWKLILAGFVLACFSFFIGFFVAAVCAASGRASRMEEEIFNPLLQRVSRPREWPDPDEQWKSARDAYGDKAEHEI